MLATLKKNLNLATTWKLKLYILIWMA
jgi:hypothetical protein